MEKRKVLLILVLLPFATGSAIEEALREHELNLTRETLTVTTVLGEPYMMYKAGSESLTGNCRFEGFGVDLVRRISRILGFNYSITPVADGEYGRQLGDNATWRGMIGELVSQRADLAVADLTITDKRGKVIDFTPPFMELGITILYNKPAPKGPDPFFFLSPLPPSVWIYTILAHLAISLFHYGLARLSISTRIVTAMWVFLTFITMSIYIANLTVLLNAGAPEASESPLIADVEDLAWQNEIAYGCVRGGSTAMFFKDSDVETYATMWTAMNKDGGSFTRTNAEGVERVLAEGGTYAHLMESASAEYIVERQCDLMQVGGLLNSVGYGIALPSDSPYTDMFSKAVLQLRQSGELHSMKEKWWKRRNGGGRCAPAVGSVTTLGIHEVGGVFVVVVVGLVVAGCVALLEHFLFKKTILGRHIFGFSKQIEQ